MDDEKEKARAMVEGEDARDAGGGKDAERGKAVEDPMEQLRTLCRGTLKLTKPMRGGGEDIPELKFDFCALTGTQMLDALDSAPAQNMFAITNAQALALFAATAGMCTERVDAHDVKKQLSAVDSVAAIQIAKLFYNASSRMGNTNISNG